MLLVLGMSTAPNPNTAHADAACWGTRGIGTATAAPACTTRTRLPAGAASSSPCCPWPDASTPEILHTAQTARSVESGAAQDIHNPWDRYDDRRGPTVRAARWCR